jgi:hypothetical protein
LITRGFHNIGWREYSSNNTANIDEEAMITLSKVKEAFPEADIKYVDSIFLLFIL